MTKSHFTSELAGIVCLLQDHACLPFSPPGAREYAEKEERADGLFIKLIGSC
jgi:hypothetical protein